MTNEDDALHTQFDDGVLTLTLNRPERLNAVNGPLFDRLLRACAEAAEDSSVRALVLRGSGRAFSSGGDIVNNSHAASLPFVERVDALRKRNTVSVLLHQMPKPTLAMLRGPVAGAGVSLALACDLRIGSDTTKFVPAFAKAGFSGDFGISYLLPMLIGQAKAREFLFLGDAVPAEEAQRIGLLHRLVADDALEGATADLARRLAEGPTLAYRYMKKNLAIAATATFEQTLNAEAEHMVLTMISEDGREAVAAFREKRPPKFSGC